MIEKEFRALLPLWSVCAAGLLASALDLPLPIRSAAAAIYIPSCAALGAYAFGHEYVHGTMPLLLAQPIARSRIYLVKLGVLALLVAALRALLFVVPFPEGRSPFASLIVPLPMLAALFVAPWLTLITRMPLAGAMFSLSLSSMVLLMAEWLALGEYGMSADVNPFKIAFIRWTMLGLCAVGAVMGWRTFARLEVAGGGGRPLFARVTRREAISTNRTLVRRSPIWLLVQKELRLQQLTFVAAAIFVGFYLFVVLRRAPNVDRSDAIQVITAIHLIASSLIVGSLASAEERHLGTLDWQLLLPMSAVRQWVVKIIFLVAFTLLLTFVLPAMLVWAAPPGPAPLYRWALPAPPASIVFALACLTASLYVSSLVSSGLRALITSLPALFAVITFTRLIGTPSLAPVAFATNLTPGTRAVLLLAVFSGVLVGVLWFALSNHRTADRSWRRVTLQVGGIAAGLAITVAVAQALGLP